MWKGLKEAAMTVIAACLVIWMFIRKQNGEIWKQYSIFFSFSKTMDFYKLFSDKDVLNWWHRAETVLVSQ